MDGVAVVSAIISSEDPEVESRGLLELMESVPKFVTSTSEKRLGPDEERAIRQGKIVGEWIKKVDEAIPLSHNMTNLVSPLVLLSPPTGTRPF